MKLLVLLPLLIFWGQTHQQELEQKREYAPGHRYSHAQVEFWRHESTPNGDVAEFYLESFASSYPVANPSGQLTYLHESQEIQVIEQHIYPKQQQQRQPAAHPHNHHHLHQNDDDEHQDQYQQHHHLLYAQQFHHHQPPQAQAQIHIHHHHQQIFHTELSTQQAPDYCASQNPSILTYNDQVQEPATCQAGGLSRGSAQQVGQHRASHNSNVDSYPLAPHPYNYESSLMSAIRHYWREVSALCLASAIFLNWLFVVVKRRFMSSGLSRAEHALEPTHRAATSKSISRDTNSSAHDSAFDESVPAVSLNGIDDDSLPSNESLSSTSASSVQSSRNLGDHSRITANISKSPSAHHTPSINSSKTLTAATNYATSMRARSSTLKATDPIPIPSTPGHNPLSVSLSNSLNSSEYISRYSFDFVTIQRLGRGGFGIVFEAKNKIDDCHYAVKRICLPLEKDARERVMREVRALAKLDHAGIVRYYNAWLETPPDDWLKQHDAQLGIVNSNDGFNFPSTDGIYDKNDTNYEQTTNGYGKQLSESGDNSSDLFTGNSPFNRRSNGFRKFLKNNSSSPSLDIVFEGSGSIRLESENNTEETSSSSRNIDDITTDVNSDISAGTTRTKTKTTRRKNGDINDSDSEDSDFIQFESKANSKLSDSVICGNMINGNSNNDDISFSSHLTEPFSSSSEDDEEEDEDEEEDLQIGDEDVFEEDNLRNSVLKGLGKIVQTKTRQQVLGSETNLKRNALNQQKELRRLNQATSLADNLHAEKAYLYIQMQLCRKDTLKDWLKINCENRDKTTIFDLFYQIVDAVEYVHSQDLIHRDLKPSNIFFSLDGTLKIGDFGLCRTKTSVGIGSSLDLQEYVAESEVERGFEAVHTEQVGTQLYMSPEQLNGLSYNQKVDIFAMGLILLELLIPFKTQMQRVNVLFKARNNLYSDDFCSENPKEHQLVKALLNRSPLKRPSATEVKQHELLSSAQLSQPVIERIYHRRRTISSNSSTE